MDREDFLVARQYLNEVSPRPDTTSVVQNDILNGNFDLTVIIPCYNEEKYLKQCLDSVIRQRKKYKIKLVIIDDGSTDGTADILKEYVGIPDVVIISQPNRGFSGARNSGLKQIDSRYLFFLDSDDYLLENTIEPMLDIADKYQADIIEAQVLNQADGQLIRTEKPFESTKEADICQLSGYVWGKLIKAELFREVHFPEQYWYEDTIMTYLIYPRCSKAVKYNQDVYVYRRNPEGITAKSYGKKKSIDTFWITELMLEDMERLDIPMDQKIYEKLLDQIALNYIRTEDMEEAVKVAGFMLTITWFAKLHQQYTTSCRFQSILEKALDIQDYKLYQEGCKILWSRRNILE
jgi:glycosyltransferase involved in cell wall biosynthesis